MKGLVVKGSRNIFTVKVAEPDFSNQTCCLYECRLKGKVLKCEEDYYNPLAPGDIVFFEADPLHPGKGMISAVEERRSIFTRFNCKGQLPQILAGNIDLVVCVSSPASPPFRPRFIDRVLVQAAAGQVPALVVLNKVDLGIDESCASRIADYTRIGCEVLKVSAACGTNLDMLRRALAGKLSVLLGQSGVGKSSLINALWPDAALKTGALNEKFDRGNHTTVQAGLLEINTAEGAIRLIDTPGVRQFVPHGITAEDLSLYMSEFSLLALSCGFGRSCTHQSEPRCAVRAAVENGTILADRYESYLRLREQLLELN